MQGTVSNRNILHRLGDAWQAWKAAPTPAQLYPPKQGIQTGYLTFPGWATVERDAGAQDEARVKKAVTSPSVFANMRAIATECSSAELVMKERKGKKLEDVENHPLEELWEAPNEYMGRAFLMAFWAWAYTMVGKSYLYWVTAGGAPVEVWPIPPFMIRPVAGGKDFIGGYVFKSDPKADPILIPRELITYSHSPNPFDIRDGLSFLVAGMTPVESEIAMGFWNRNFFDEGNGIPDGMIALGRDTLDSDVARVRLELRDFFGGTKRGLAIARENDMKYVPWGRTQKDAEFTEGIKLASTQIGRTMGFPDGYWSESANRANAEQARATMIAGAVWPLLVALHEDLNAGIVRRFYGEQFRAEFKDIRPEDRALKLQELQFYAQIETVNELRERIGADALDDPRGLMLLAEITKGAPLPATPASEETEEYLQEQEAEAGVGEAPEEVGAIPPEGGELPPEEAPMPEEEAAPMPTKSVIYRGQLGDIPLSDDMLLDAGFTKSDEGWMPPKSMIDPRATDLANWERKALKSLKRFHAADVRFTSDAIPFPEQVAIHEALKAAETVEEVKAAFNLLSHPTLGDRADRDEETKGADETLIDEEWGAALEWAKKARGA